MHYILSPLEIEQSVACALHVPLALCRHSWTHGIAQFIGGDHGETIAEKVNFILKHHCGVVLNAQKVADGLVQDAARMPRLPGAPARGVCVHWDLILNIVMFLTAEAREDEDLQDLFKTSVACNDALIAL